MDDYRAFVERVFPDPDVRSTVLLQLAESILAASAVSPGCWSLSFRDQQLRLNVGRLEVLVALPHRLDVIIDREATDEQGWQHVRQELDLTFKWEGEPFRVLPSAYGVQVPDDRIADVLPILRPLHLALVQMAAQTVTTRTPYYRAHVPELMDYLREEVADDLPDPDYGVEQDPSGLTPRFWKVSAGIGGDHWPEFRDGNWVAVNWTHSPDLRLLDAESPNTLQELLNAAVFETTFSLPAAKQLWTFQHTMGIGDRVCAYGAKTILGLGTIIGNYDFDEDAKDFRHRRAMDWVSTSPISTDTLSEPLATKLMRNITILELTEEDYAEIASDENAPEQSSNYWWVNQGATYEQESAGGYLWAPKVNKAGYAFAHWTNMTLLQSGDVVIHYANTAIRALGKVQASAISAPLPSELPSDTWEKDGYYVQVAYEPLASPISLRELPAEWRAPGPGPFTQEGGVKQGYLYPLTATFMTNLCHQFGDRLPEDGCNGLEITGERGAQQPTLDQLVELTHLERADLQELEELLLDKRQLVLEGPPGSGKTYLAEHFARYFAGLPLNGAEDERVETVQFHQSYGYEDFVQGIRPVTTEQGQLQYHVVPGIFLRMCDLASRNPTQRFVLIIDEINRGNLSRIFGELLLLLEYRDKRVRLPYGAVEGQDGHTYLTIPKNLYLIGTMNSTDRSLALIDYALRRRFYFYRLLPVVNGQAPVLARWLDKQGLAEEDQTLVLRLFTQLNAAIEEHLSPDYQVGHSYFMREDIHTERGRQRVWQRAILPLLEEYLHGVRSRESVLAELTLERLLADPAVTPALDAFDPDQL